MKYKKKEVHMIDMTDRLHMKIVHEEYTSADEEEWENEMREMKRKIEERMQRYEEEIKILFTTTSLKSNNVDTDKMADYFIETYGDKFIGRNEANIQNRLRLYEKYLSDSKKEQV